MATIAVIIDNLFEDSEYSEPVLAFSKNGHKLVTVGVTAGATVTGKKNGMRVAIDRSIEEVRVSNYDALLIPGGYSPDKLRVHDAAVTFARDFTRSGKPVFAICHAPQLLITADVLNGRRMTGYKSIAQDIKNAGAEYVDEAVVVDGNLITSRYPGDLPAFITASLDSMKVLKKGGAK